MSAFGWLILYTISVFLVFLSIFCYFQFIIKEYVNTGKSNSQVIIIIIIIIIISLSLVTGLFFLVLLLNQLWSPPSDFSFHTAVLSLLYDVPIAAVLCRESIELLLLLLLLLLLTAEVVVIVLLAEVDIY